MTSLDTWQERQDAKEARIEAHARSGHLVSTVCVLEHLTPVALEGWLVQRGRSDLWDVLRQNELEAIS